MIVAAEPLDRLTERERQIFGLMGEGWGISEIAGDLLLRPATVRYHVANMRTKLSVRSTADVARMAVVRHVLGQRGLAKPVPDLSKTVSRPPD